MLDELLTIADRVVAMARPVVSPRFAGVAIGCGPPGGCVPALAGAPPAVCEVAPLYADSAVATLGVPASERTAAPTARRTDSGA